MIDDGEGLLVWSASKDPAAACPQVAVARSPWKKCGGALLAWTAETAAAGEVMETEKKKAAVSEQVIPRQESVDQVSYFGSWPQWRR